MGQGNLSVWHLLVTHSRAVHQPLYYVSISIANCRAEEDKITLQLKDGEWQSLVNVYAVRPPSGMHYINWAGGREARSFAGSCQSLPLKISLERLCCCFCHLNGWLKQSCRTQWCWEGASRKPSFQWNEKGVWTMRTPTPACTKSDWELKERNSNAITQKNSVSAKKRFLCVCACACI